LSFAFRLSKKRIVRTLIHEVVADIDEEASEIVIVVHWVGGAHSEMRVPNGVASTGTVVYGLLALAEVFSIFRACFDARYYRH
jgi:hypothetical protein